MERLGGQRGLFSLRVTLSCHFPSLGLSFPRVKCGCALTAVSKGLTGSES